MKKLGMAIVIAAALGAGFTATAQAAPIGAADLGKSAGTLGLVEKTQFIIAGREYCWYDGGWRGPGWYWCGYAWRTGYGWGGPRGFHGWVYSGWGGGSHYSGGGSWHGSSHHSSSWHGGSSHHSSRTSSVTRSTSSNGRHSVNRSVTRSNGNRAVTTSRTMTKGGGTGTHVSTKTTVRTKH